MIGETVATDYYFPGKEVAHVGFRVSNFLAKRITSTPEVTAVGSQESVLWERSPCSAPADE